MKLNLQTDEHELKRPSQLLALTHDSHAQLAHARWCCSQDCFRWECQKTNHGCPRSCFETICFRAATEGVMSRKRPVVSWETDSEYWGSLTPRGFPVSVCSADVLHRESERRGLGQTALGSATRIFGSFCCVTEIRTSSVLYKNWLLGLSPQAAFMLSPVVF